jgi:hypothetical protein
MMMRGGSDCGRTSARFSAAFFVLFVLSVVIAAHPAAADTVRVGAARINIDGARWQAADVSDDGVTFVPKGAIASRLDEVHLSRHAAGGDATCERLPQDFLALHDYDPRSYRPSRVVIGGREGTRIAADKPCRNATPIGVIACVKAGSDIYVLSALQADCGGVNLFSGIDPLDEIAKGVSFEE